MEMMVAAIGMRGIDRAVYADDDRSPLDSRFTIYDLRKVGTKLQYLALPKTRPHPPINL